MLGYSEDELPKTPEQIHPPEEIPSMERKVRALADGRARLAEDIRFVRKDGSVFFADVSGSPLLYDGRPCLVSLIRDTTERREAQETLRASEERFRVAFDEAPVGMVIGVKDGVIARVNRALCQMTGYIPEELIGRHVQEFQHPEDRDLSLPLVKKLFAGEIPSFTVERRYVAKGGRVFWAQATTAAARNPDGTPAFALGVIEDITQRKQAEEALRQRHAELQTIYDGTIEGILITDIETRRFLRVNSSFCRMLGYSEEELLTKSIPDIHPPEEAPDDLRRFQAAADGRCSINENRPVLRKDGSIFYADITGNRILYEGRPCLLALFRDITERREAQEALKRERRTLEHLLRASDHERQLIAYDIHDGLAQQLAAAVMQFQTYEHLKQHHPESAKTAYDAGVQMLRQAHFEARRLISGVRPPILDESGIAAAIAHLVHEYRALPGPEVELNSQVSFDRLPSVLENAIYRIAQEALANACRHSRSQKVRVSLAQEQHQVRLEVQDWGFGFDPKSVGEDRFGLEGIRERTRLLGGQMEIESQPTKGTLIRVVLPLVE
jgi:PAS domain S-box-containing protein